MKMAGYAGDDPDLTDDPVDDGRNVWPEKPQTPKAERSGYVPLDDPDMTDDDVGPGTKRVNKRGLLITFGILGLLLSFTVYQLMGMGNLQGYRKEEVVLDSLDSARSIASRMRLPNVPETAVVIPPPSSPEPPPAPPPLPPAPESRRLSGVAQKKPEGPDALTLELMRLEQVRQKQFEAAITGGLRVKMDIAASANPYSAPGSAARDKTEMLAAVRAERARAEAMISEYGSDATMAYRRRAADLGAGGFAANLPASSMANAVQTSYGGDAVYTGDNMPDVADAGGGEVPAAASAPARMNSAMGGAARRGNSLEDFDGDASRWVSGSAMEIPSRFMIRAGAVIPAVLLSGINSDLPGQILAQVSENVYDAATGRYLLIPQGTRLIGGYSSEVQYGQSRVFAVWQRLVFPDGRAYDLGSHPATTGAGYAGMRDRVNFHLMRVFGSALLMSAVVAGVSYSQDQGGSSGDNGTRMSDSLSEALGQQMGQVTVEMIRRNMNISPTIEIRPGFRLNVMLVRDVAFKSSYKAFDYEYSAFR
jgi:type IV secretion system protein VirB10